MANEVKVSLKQGLNIPMLCVICGSSTNLYPRGYFVYGRTNQFFANYSGMFHFPVCYQCAMIRQVINNKRKNERTNEENLFLKLYDKQAVTCRIGYHPLLDIKWAKFSFHQKDYAEAFKENNRAGLI